MAAKRVYNLLVLLLPIVYFFHNLEEWLVFRVKASDIHLLIPKHLSSFLPNNPNELYSIFGIAVIFATLMPTIIAFYLWGKFTAFNAKMLIILAFTTLVNSLSHITSSFVFGFISPGLITALLFCIPYAVGVIIFDVKCFSIGIKQYFLLGIASIGVYLFAVAISWFLAVGIYSLF
ncbi:MAG: HXXEE domain-containing protein [Bacteroidales bacterium]|nr:HXXEE domain-containing protein [Bacteroidales bacterium]